MTDPPPPPPTPGDHYRGPAPVGPWPRLGARIIDSLILFIPGILVSAVVGGGGTSPFDAALDGGTLAARVVLTGLGFAYYVWFESTRGQTPGKMALGYRVVGPTGAHPSSDEAVRRNAWMLLSAIPFLGDIAGIAFYIIIGVTISSDPFKRGWHDNFAGGTAVVRTG